MCALSQQSYTSSCSSIFTIRICVYLLYVTVTGVSCQTTMGEKLPTLYEYYTSNGIKSGLSDGQQYFTINNKNITIYSGALHYFRVHPDYWRDRLRKLRAAGLNTVETYVPWNLHEPEIGVFDFGEGNSEFEQFLDIKKFLRIAQEEDLFAIVRPGPYICAEWEFGGLPSWLLRYKSMKIRTSDKQYIELVERYYKRLLSILAPLQFTKGGPIIAIQIENEYGNTKDGENPVDTKYLETLKDILTKNGITELLFTSDTPSNGFSGTLPNVLATANFQEDATMELTKLKEFQPDKPLMVMEYWTGWFDHWTDKHHTRTADAFAKVLEEIIQFNSSFNMYMFHGGTNWGLLNGANIKDLSTDNGGYLPDTTSYDYDAPLSEAGDYTDKYFKVKELIRKYSTVSIRQPDVPPLVKRIAYPTINITQELNITSIIEQSKFVLESDNVIPMELLDINNKSGQSYGYIVYRKERLNIPKNAVIKIEGRVCDSILVLINGKLVSKTLSRQSDLNEFGYWRLKDSTLKLENEEYKDATLDLIVENWGRNNYGKLNQFEQHKGLWQGNVLLNDTVLLNWKIIPIEFKKNWTNNLKEWSEKPKFNKGPTLYKGILTVDETRDSFIDLRDWNKGIVIVNGFVLARYVRLGPQQTAYLPAPFLKKGENEIIVFEHFEPSKFIKFSEEPIFETLI